MKKVNKESKNTLKKQNKDKLPGGLHLTMGGLALNYFIFVFIFIPSL